MTAYINVLRENIEAGANFLPLVLARQLYPYSAADMVLEEVPS